MSKNMIYGAGVLGIIAAAIYIYKEHKKAKEAEAESVVNIDSEETEDTAKEQKKEVITEKVTSLGRKIGKTLGSAALKFGAKHPKITKFILKFGRYIPYAALGIAILASLPFYNRARDFMEGVDPDSINITDNSIEFTRYLPEDDDEAYKNTCKAYHKLVEDNTFVPIEKIGNDSDVTFAVKNKELDIADKIRESWENGTGRTNWEKVKACADTLELNPHEAFAIYNIDEFEGTDAYKEAVEKGQKYFMRQQYACEVK